MLEVKIKNNMLNEAVDFFFGMTLKGKESRMRTRFIKLISSEVERVAEEEREILKEYCVLNDDGELEQNEDGTAIIKKGKEEVLMDERLELLNEEFIIDDSNSQNMLMTVRKILDECDMDLSERKAVLYDYLCEQFKVDEDLEEEQEG